MTIHVGDLKARAERAIETFEANRGKLFRADGKTKVYSDDEHAERLTALRSERNTVLREVEQEIRIAIEEANADLTALENGDPTTLLSSEELARANARRALVTDDVAVLTEEELQGRLEAVLHGGDRDSMFVYLQAGAGGSARYPQVGSPRGYRISSTSSPRNSSPSRARLRSTRRGSASGKPEKFRAWRILPSASRAVLTPRSSPSRVHRHSPGPMSSQEPPSQERRAIQQ